MPVIVMLLCILLKVLSNCGNYIKNCKNIENVDTWSFLRNWTHITLIYYNFFIVLVYINLRKKDQVSTFFLPQKGSKRTNWSLFTNFHPKSAIFQTLTVGPFSIFSCFNSKIKKLPIGPTFYANCPTKFPSVKFFFCFKAFEIAKSIGAELLK